jgi:hypothetical protein
MKDILRKRLEKFEESTNGWRANDPEMVIMFANLVILECCDMVNAHIQYNNPNDSLLVLDIKERFGIDVLPDNE